MTNKTKKILVYVAAGLIIVGAILGIVVDVNGGVEPETQVQDTVATQVVDTLATDSIAL